MLSSGSKVHFSKLTACDGSQHYPDSLSPSQPISTQATIGSFWSLQVDRALEDTSSVARAPSESFAADSSEFLQPAKTDWETIQGLGLYVLSTLLLSVQATSAKLLG